MKNSHYSIKGISVSTNPSVETPTPAANTNLVAGLAMTGGLGILLIIIGFMAGVFDPNMNSGIIGLTVLAGILFLVGAIVTWAAVVRPFDHFDDINVPQYTGHAHDAHAPEADASADHAADDHAHPAPSAASH